MMRWAFGVALVLVGACVSQQPMSYRDLEQMANRQQREAISRPPPDTCQMAAHQGLIGTEGAGVDPASLPAGARVICHDCAVSLDYRADRLNVLLGADGKVAYVPVLSIPDRGRRDQFNASALAAIDTFRAGAKS